VIHQEFGTLAFRIGRDLAISFNTIKDHTCGFRSIGKAFCAIMNIAEKATYIAATH